MYIAELKCKTCREHWKLGSLGGFASGRMSVSVNSSDHVCENGTEHVELLLPATNDAHGGVIVDMREAMDPQAFLTLLRASISQWRQEVLLSYTFNCFHHYILLV